MCITRRVLFGMLGGAALMRAQAPSHIRPQAKRLNAAHQAFVAEADAFAEVYNLWVAYASSVSPASPNVLRHVTEDFLKLIPDAWIKLVRSMAELQSVVGVIHRDSFDSLKGKLQAADVRSAREFMKAAEADLATGEARWAGKHRLRKID